MGLEIRIAIIFVKRTNAMPLLKRVFRDDRDPGAEMMKNLGWILELVRTRLQKLGIFGIAFVRFVYCDLATFWYKTDICLAKKQRITYFPRD